MLLHNKHVKEINSLKYWRQKGSGNVNFSSRAMMPYMCKARGWQKPGKKPFWVFCNKAVMKSAEVITPPGKLLSVQLARMLISRSTLKLSLPRYSDAFRVDILGGDGFLQFVQLSRLLQLLHQALHRFFTPLLLLAVLLSLLPAQKSFDNGGSERQNWHLLSSAEVSPVSRSPSVWKKHGGTSVPKALRVVETTGVKTNCCCCCCF